MSNNTTSNIGTVVVLAIGAVIGRWLQKYHAPKIDAAAQKIGEVLNKANPFSSDAPPSDKP